jgi:hypothetical protein
MLSGALVFVDEMFAPSPHPLVHRTHVVVYSTSDPPAFATALDYYLTHPLEARQIARRGYLFALQYHRAVSRVDYFLRTAHEQELHDAAAAGATVRRRPPGTGTAAAAAAAAPVAAGASAVAASERLRGRRPDARAAAGGDFTAAALAGNPRYAHTGRTIHKAPAHAMLVNPAPQNWQ